MISKLPKEKAEELVNKFENIDIEYNDSIEGNCFMTMTKLNAKQCAIEAVDEIIEAIFWHPLESPNQELEYWQEVKQEIEKL